MQNNQIVAGGGDIKGIFVKTSKIFIHTFEEVISLDNLLSAWQEFRRGKRKRADVQQFEFNLMGNLIALHDDLASQNYRHGGYHTFNICDPKPRSIHKASVRDRLVHHAVYRILYPFFDRIFAVDSYSCRLNKGTHKALKRFKKFAYQGSRNNTCTCWILKGDIRKFFASIDHQVLKSILKRHIIDKRILNLWNEIIDSFCVRPNSGLPLGNLTSQLLVNIYLNEFDRFIKHRLKIKHYLRYCDDFVIMSPDKKWLQNQIQSLEDFLSQKLKLTLHPDKVFIKTLNSGVDFLGWVNFFNHRVLRTKTRRRMFKRIKNDPERKTINSYLGLLKQGNTFKIEEKCRKFWQNEKKVIEWV